MQATAPPGDARDHEMISAMTECAFQLGHIAAEVAKRAGDDTALFFKATAEFQRCFFAVRMGIRLRQWGPGSRPAARAEPREEERPDWAEQPERDDSGDRLVAERERDRDDEPVSLPRFLKTLGLVAASAEQRRDDLPPPIRDTTLPTLEALLRKANAPPGAPAARGPAPKSPARTGPAPNGSALAVLARPPAAPAVRSRLLTSTVSPSVAPLSSTSSRRRPSG